MNITSLKQRLSLHNLWQSLQRVVLRFPVAVCLLTALTAQLTYMVIADPPKSATGFQTLMVFLPEGFVISLAVSLWGEEQKSKRLRWLAECIALALWGVYSILLFYTDLFPNKDLPAFYIGNVAWGTAIILFALLGSFLREKDDLKAWHFIFSSIGALLISGIVSWLMVGGVEGLLAGTGALFDFKPSEKLMFILMILGAVMLFGLLFCALLPQGERKHNTSADMPSLLRKLVSWLLLPLLGCYIVVLYAYGISILVHWELPKGLLSILVSCVMIGYVLCFVLLYPEVTKRDTWQSRLLTRWLPVIILPLLVLMTVGIVRRVVDYGITAPRLYVLTMLLWFYAICIVMLVAKRKRFNWIIWSFGALFLLTSGQPLNYYRICRPILTAKIDRIVADKQLQLPLYIYGLTDNSALTESEANSLRDDLLYMRKNYGDEYASRWSYYSWNDSTGTIASLRTETWSLSYYTPNNEVSYPCPQGFTSFRRINRWTTRSISADSLQGSVLHINLRYGEKDYILLFDTVSIAAAKAGKTALVVPSSDNQVAFALDDIDMTAYNDSTIDIQYDGWLFTK